MAQIRFHNYKRPLVSFDENLRLAGLAAPGRICGFDTLNIIGGTTLSLSHGVTGLVATDIGGAAHNPYGCMQSRQGNVILEDDVVEINVDYNVGNANDRIDLVVMEHAFLNSIGGAPASYSIIKGVLTGAQEPVLSAPEIQVIVGKLLIKGGAVDHTTTVYEPADPTISGGVKAVLKVSDTDVKDSSSIINPGRVVVGAQVLADFNRLTKTGMHSITTTLNRPTTATNTWLVVVMKKGVKVTQFATDPTTGSVYSRFSGDTGTTWGTWISMNNPEVLALVGDLQYLSNFFVDDDDDLTLAVSKLDAALNAVNGGVLRAVVNTPVWNMDSTPSLNVPNPVDGSKIISITGHVRNDNGIGPVYFPITQGSNSNEPDLWIEKWDHGVFPAYIVLHRKTGGPFDDPNFSNISSPRGVLLVEYIYP